MALAKGNESTAALRRFGDEESTLFDRFERLSFEAHLNQAVLARSLSTTGGAKFRREAAEEQQVMQGRRRWGINGALKNIFRPVFGRKRNTGENGKQNLDPKFPQYSKAFGKSVRF